jgi:hypothetical protein
MKPQTLFSLATIALLAACSDDPSRKAEAAPSEPPTPVLTAKMLPPTASSVCVASVRQRDGILAAVSAPNGVSSTTVLSAKQRADLSALDEMIDDVCK